MSPVALRLNAAALAVLVCSLALVVDSGRGYIRANPSAPYRTAADTQFWNIVKTFNDPTQVGREGDLVRTGMYNARRASRLVPAIRSLGTIGLSPDGYTWAAT